MKHTVVTPVLAAEEDEWDRKDACDVYFLDPYPGEPEIAPDLRSAFEKQGYSVRSVELARTHPVIIVSAIRKGAGQMTDEPSLRRHFRHVLRQTGCRVRRDELVVGRRGKGLIIAFLWKDSPVDTRPTAEEMKDQYEPIP